MNYRDLEIVEISLVNNSLIHNKVWKIRAKIKKHWIRTFFWSKQIEESHIRTFVGSGGLDWSEIKEGKYFGVGELLNILNEVVTIEILKKVNNSRATSQYFENLLD
ncbi:MAG: hypothetical protein WC679_00090 [Bacteroidales bacterium]|jgi:hypothetical protein